MTQHDAVAIRTMQRTIADQQVELEKLRAIVKLADDLYVAAAEKFQDISDKEYMDEFGIKGPSLAGFLQGGADREYHYARHHAGECPLPRHVRLRRGPSRD